MSPVTSFDLGYGPTEDEFLLYTGRTVDNSAEFRRQRARAQEVLDAICGPWPKFHEARSISLDTITSTTLASADLTSSQSGYYNNLELRIIEGTGRGFRGYLGDYNGSTKVATVSGVSSVEFSSASTSDTAALTQIANFPRYQDQDTDGRPRVPECLPRIIAYILEYWVDLDSQGGFNSSELANQQAALTSESIGSWSASYSAERNPAREMIGPKAYELALREGLFNRSGRLRRY